MTVDDVIQRLTELRDGGQVPGTLPVLAWDADQDRVMPVVGFLYGDRAVVVQTDKD